MNRYARAKLTQDYRGDAGAQSTKGRRTRVRQREREGVRERGGNKSPFGTAERRRREGRKEGRSDRITGKGGKSLTRDVMRA